MASRSNSAKMEAVCAARMNLEGFLSAPVATLRPCRRLTDRRRQWTSESVNGGQVMADIVYVAVTAAFFYLTWLFVKLCDGL